MRNALLLALLFALSCVSRIASAQSADIEARRTAYREGYAAIQAKKWEEAYAIFERLWREAPTYDVALHLGHAEFNLGKNREAAEHLAFGVAHLPPGETKDVAEGSRRALERVKQEVGTITLISDRAGTAVRIDGDPRGITPIDTELFLDPGAHSVEATLAGYQPTMQNFQVARGEHLNLVVKLEPLAPSLATTAPTPVPPTPTAPPPHGEPHTGPSARTVALLSGAGVTVAAGVATLVFALKGSAASKRADDARAEAANYGPNACQSPMTAPASVCSSIQKAEDDRVAANRGANVSLAVTGVALLATATMFVVWPRKTASGNASITLTPVASRNSGTLSINGTF